MTIVNIDLPKWVAEPFSGNVGDPQFGIRIDSDEKTMRNTNDEQINDEKIFDRLHGEEYQRIGIKHGIMQPLQNPTFLKVGELYGFDMGHQTLRGKVKEIRGNEVWVEEVFTYDKRLDKDIAVNFDVVINLLTIMCYSIKRKKND